MKTWKRNLIVFGGATIWISIFTYLTIGETDMIQKSVWVLALVCSPILFWGLENMLKDVKEDKEVTGK